MKVESIGGIALGLSRPRSILSRIVAVELAAARGLAWLVARAVANAERISGKDPAGTAGRWSPWARLGGVAVLAVGIGLAVPHASTAATSAADTRAAIECQGSSATIVGTFGRDVLTGTTGRDVIWGGRGNDVIRSRGGNDIICAGKGSDNVWAGQGEDSVLDFHGELSAHGGAGDDVLRSAAGSPTLFGGSGADLLRTGGTTASFLLGGGGPDNLVGSDREGVIGDVLTGGSGRDLIRARGGFDEIQAVPGDGDVVFGGSGEDAIMYWFQRIPIRASLLEGRVARRDGKGLIDRIFGVENLAGSEAADVLIGSAGPDTLVGQGGADEIFGRGGSDLLLGDGGDDFLDGGAPGSGGVGDADLLFGRTGVDTCLNGNAFGHTFDDDPSCEVTDDTP